MTYQKPMTPEVLAEMVALAANTIANLGLTPASVAIYGAPTYNNGGPHINITVAPENFFAAFAGKEVQRKDEGHAVRYTTTIGIVTVTASAKPEVTAPVTETIRLPAAASPDVSSVAAGEAGGVGGGQ